MQRLSSLSWTLGVLEGFESFSKFSQFNIKSGRYFALCRGSNLLTAASSSTHTGVSPYSLVTPVTRVIRDLSADQPIEHAATLEDVRAEVLTPDRLNSLLLGCSRLLRWRLRWWASQECWRFRSARGRVNSASDWRLDHSRSSS